MPITEELDLELGPALRAIREELDTAFETAVSNFQTGLNEAISSITFRPITTEAEESATTAGTALQDSLSGAVESFDAAPIATTLGEAGTAGGEALSGALTDSVDSFDASPIGDEIEAIDASVPVEADTTAIEPAISEAVSSVEAPPVEVEVDASDGLEALRELQEEIGGLRGEADELASSLGEVGTGTGGATQGMSALTSETGKYSTVAETATISTAVLSKGGTGLGQTLAGVATKAGPAGVALAGVATTIGALGLGAAEAVDVGERFGRTFGPDLAAQIEQVDIGGLNEDLSALSIRAGASDDDLRKVAIGIGILGEQSGRSQESVAGTVEQFIALSFALAGANPELGTASELADRLPAILAKGGKAAAGLGLDLSAADIEARALADNIGKTAEELTQYDKAAAGASLASEALGDTFGTKVAQGAESAQGRIRSLKTEVGETIEALGAPLVEPVIGILEVATSALTSLLGLLEDVGAITFFSNAVEDIGTALLFATDLVNLFRVGLSGLFAIVPGGKGPLEAMEESYQRINEETGKLPGTLALAKLGFIDSGDGAQIMSDNLAGAAITASEFTLAIDDTTVATEEAAAAYEAMVQSVSESFESAGEVLARFSKDEEISFKEFKKDLEDTAQAGETFVRNLDTIISKGGLQIAASLAQLGPEVASRAATEIAKQTPATIASLEAQEAVIRRRTLELAIETVRITAEAKAAAILIDGGLTQAAAIQVVEGAHGTVLAKIGELTPKEAAAYINTQSGGILAGTLQVTEAARSVIGTASAAAATEGILGGRYVGRSHVDGIDNTLGASGGRIAGAAISAAGALGNASGRARSEGAEVGHNFLSGLYAGLSNRGLIGAVTGAAYAAGAGLKSAANAGARSWSPSRDGMEVGQNFIDGIRLGIERNAFEVRRAASELGGSLGEAASFRVSDLPAFRLPVLTAIEPSAASLAARAGAGSSVVVAEGAFQFALSFGPGIDLEQAKQEFSNLADTKILAMLQKVLGQGKAGPA